MTPAQVQLYASVAALAYFVLLLLFVMRANHWAYKTQERLEQTNRLLKLLTTSDGGAPK